MTDQTANAHPAANPDQHTGAAPRKRRLRLVPLLETRQTVAESHRVVCYGLSLLAASALSVGLLASAGVSPPDLIREITTVAFSSPRALGSVLAQAAPLAIAGLATAVAFRANFWNIGLEGQMDPGSHLCNSGGPV